MYRFKLNNRWENKRFKYGPRGWDSLGIGYFSDPLEVVKTSGKGERLD